MAILTDNMESFQNKYSTYTQYAFHDDILFSS